MSPDPEVLDGPISSWRRRRAWRRGDVSRPSLRDLAELAQRWDPDGIHAQRSLFAGDLTVRADRP